MSLIVREQPPTAGMQSEHVKILRLCRRPVSVVEIAAQLELPVSVVKVLLLDLAGQGSVTIRQPDTRRRLDTRRSKAERDDPPLGMQLPDLDTLKQVLVGLQRL